MKSVSKKISIIIILIVLILAIGGGVFAYLILATDTFKGAEELFFKYFSQNINSAKELFSSKTIETYRNIQDTGTYEANTTIHIKDAEGGEISSAYNDLSFQLKEQKDLDYNYKDFKIMFGEQNAIELEGIKSDDLYGIRFSNLLKVFVSLENGEKIEGLNINDEQVDTLKAIIEDDVNYFQDYRFTKDEIERLENRYLSILSESIKEGSFSKQKSSLITINSSTIKANAYSVELSSYQVQNLIIKILNNLKVDDIISNKFETISKDNERFENLIDSQIREFEDMQLSAVKVTIYEKNGVAVRIVIDAENDDIVIENSSQDGNDKMTINYTSLNSEKEISRDIEISRRLTETQENYEFVMDVIEDDKEYSISAALESDFSSTDFYIGYKEGIKEIRISAENTISNNVTEKIALDSQNNIILNDLVDPNLSQTLAILNVQVPQKLNDRYNLLISKLQATSLIEKVKGKIKDVFGAKTFGEDESQIQNPVQDPTNEASDMTPAEISRFNAKFEFYTGTGVSAENVKILLDVAKDNLESVDITKLEDENNYSGKDKESIKLNIMVNKSNVELANSIIEKIDKNEKYNVTITTNSTSGIIESITIVPMK